MSNHFDSNHFSGPAGSSLTTYTESVSSEITVSQHAASTPVGTADSAISVTSSIDNAYTVRRPDTVETAITATDNLTVDEAPSSPRTIYATASSEIEIADNYNNQIPVTISQQILTEQYGRRAHEASASSAITVDSNACRGERVNSTVAVTQAVTYFTTHTCSSVIAAAQEATYVRTIALTVTSAITPLSYATGYFVRQMTEVVIANKGLLPPPDHVELSYDSEYLELSNPVYGNSEVTNPYKNINISRHNRPWIFRDTNWTSESKLRVKFTHVSRTQKTALESFVRISAGKEIQYKDHEGITWAAYILNPNLVFREHGRGCFDEVYEELYEVELELMASTYGAIP